jgi:hypothetical protein
VTTGSSAASRVDVSSFADVRASASRQGDDLVLRLDGGVLLLATFGWRNSTAATSSPDPRQRTREVPVAPPASPP